MSKGITMKVNVPGRADQSPNAQLGTRVPAQDYQKLKRQALASGTLFSDPYFPADQSSLFFSQKLPFEPVWKRPGEICEKPKLFSGGADRFDVQQGMLGDCWLVSAIASITQDKIIFKKIVPGAEEQNFDRGYCGIFHFRFWHFGEWVDIVVDDRLPTHNNKLIFIHSTDDDEFWSALLEKAYAKLYGGYESLKGGKTAEAMTDFTGGVVESFELAKANQELFAKILKNSQRSSLMSCSIKATDRGEVESKLDNGLVKGHAYSVTGASTVPVRGSTVNLVRIRNPWGQKEWNGPWSDESNNWKMIPNELRKTLNERGDDGEFWMSFEDFKKNYTDVEFCSVSVDTLYEDEAVKNFNSVTISGSWSGKSAGGCRNFPTFTDNPQYVIDLDEDDDGDGKCSCLIALMQKNRRKQKKMGVQDLCIGFSIYKAPDDGPQVITKQYVDYHYSTGTSGSFTNAREVHARFELDPGRYIIIPCSFKPGEEGDFLLRIFTEAASDKKSGDGATQNPKPNPRLAKLQEMFTKLAGADGEIDGEELQDILTASYAKDGLGSVFSMDACRSMIAMFDEDKNGTLNFPEFAQLLQTIANWKKMFFKFDRDRSGTLEKAEIGGAIRSLGYDVSPANLNILFNRFSRRRRYMRLDDFSACLCRMKIMDDTFKKHSQSGRVTLSKEEFFGITLDA